MNKLNYNPDVLSCLANLSNDEVFTPPQLANQMLDMLPQQLFQSPDTKFLDPCTKSGVFLREIAKRLIDGLADKIPDLQERIDHIMHHQLYGIAITRLTSLMSRRSLYCSKNASGKYSLSHFDDADGNIHFDEILHTWQNGKCIYCGASQEVYDRGEDLETHAYEFIHTDNPKELYNNMTFDVIIGNPPYQLETGTSKQAKPIYHYFVKHSKRLNPRYLLMIIPSRWFAGGMGLDDFRKEMMEDEGIKVLVDFVNAKDCFPQNSISGGVCYFFRDSSYQGKCSITNVKGEQRITTTRSLHEFPVLVRYNEAVPIINKVKMLCESPLSEIVSPISPFGFGSYERGDQSPSDAHSIKLYSSAGVGYVSRNEIIKGIEYLECYKVMLSQTGAEHAGEPAKDGTFRVFPNTLKVLGPKEICTHSYILVGKYDNVNKANNLYMYLKTAFVRFLSLMAMSSIHLSKSTFIFVPQQDFSKPWTDEELYKKYGLTDEEIAFIESMIRPME